MCLLGDVPATRPFKSAIRTVVRVCATKYKRISIGLTLANAVRHILGSVRCSSANKRAY